MTDTVRLSRRVAEIAGCSRADAERYIRNGWVSVDGVVVEAPQHRVADEQVVLAAEAERSEVEPATLLLHKPAGMNLLGPGEQARWARPEAHWPEDPSDVRPLQRHFHGLTLLAPLEAEASGLVVLSQDRRIIRRLTEEANLIEHEYVVEVSGDMRPDGLQRLSAGISRAGRSLPPCRVSWQNETRLRFAIKAVRPGQLREICSAVGLAVVSIRRLRIGRIPLGKGAEGAMPAGQWRYLPVGERF
ncbi:rRNA pseudouridine synthase [Pseudomarimonas salicorniae]|uniref:rRNA pseudouridine synthase n=1 Tax=Pseudomarimonas salicorniae TaxID=2933270 RepID=A0ABT0GEM1_9GAMM|nr:rRNA pseudouridine synthase [Lysobacter sp. CAU 1642]MCK7592999.1 rRNA pseudouridine synthase [Lysobacter sp. CAU 1642]